LLGFLLRSFKKDIPMNRSIFFRGALLASITLCAMNIAHAQPLTVTTVISGPNRCDHVIRMLQRHGVNNSFDRTAASSLLNYSPLGNLQVPSNELGDLQIVRVSPLPPGEPSGGPQFSIVVMNQSCREVCHFHVSAVAVFGSINPCSPSNTVKVDKINPGEAVEVVVQLPIEAFRMGNRNGEILGYQKLIVAIDCFDALLETDEANNIRSFDAAEFVVVPATVSVTAISVLESSGNFPVGTEQAPAFNTLSTPTITNAEVSVDALDLEHPTPDSLRSAIQKVGSTPPQPGIPVLGNPR